MMKRAGQAEGKAAVPLKKHDRRVLRQAVVIVILFATLFVASVGWSMLFSSDGGDESHRTALGAAGRGRLGGGGEVGGGAEDTGGEDEEEEEEEEKKKGDTLASPPSPPSPPLPPLAPPPPPPPRYGMCGDAPVNMQPQKVRKFDYCPRLTGAARRYAPADLKREAHMRPKPFKPWMKELVTKTRKKYAWMEKREGGLEMIEKEEDALAEAVGPGFQTMQKFHLQRAGGRGCGPRGNHVIENENYSPDAPAAASMAATGAGSWRNDPSKGALRACVLDLSRCDTNATAAARALPSVAALIAARRAGFKAPLTQAPFPSPSLASGGGGGARAMRRAAEGGGGSGGGNGNRGGAGGAKLGASVLYDGKKKVGNVQDFLPPAVDGRKAKYRSCAVVGNAGHLTSHKWGKFIDRHEVRVVVRV